MAKLGRKRGTIEKASNALTGFGAALITRDGDEVGIVAPTIRGLEVVWNHLNWMAPLDKSKVRRVVYFPREALTALRPRKRRTTSKQETNSKQPDEYAAHSHECYLRKYREGFCDCELSKETDVKHE